MDHNAGNICQVLRCLSEGSLDVGGCNPGIRSLQGDGYFSGVNMGKGAGNPDVDFPYLGAGLFLRVADGAADCLVELTGIVPALLQISVILCDACRDNIAALAAAVFGDKRNNLARAEVNGRNRRFHSLSSLP